jgi:hypothetical protein
MLVLSAGGAFAQDPKGIVRDVLIVSGRVDRIDTFGRSVTIRTAEGPMHTIYVGRELKTFDELRTGDPVTVRVSESVVVAVRPGAKMTAIEDSTAAAKKSPRGASADVLQQLKAVVRVESVDMDRQVITYKTADNRSVMRQVTDRHLIEMLKPGDVVEISYTRERALEITKNR